MAYTPPGAMGISKYVMHDRAGNIHGRMHNGTDYVIVMWDSSEVYSCTAIHFSRFM